MPTQKLTTSAYSVGDCALAALTGALANSLALSLLSKDSGGSIFLAGVFFAVGFLVLAFAGRPLARNLAAEGRDTLGNGLVLGAATGSLAGTILAGIAIGLLFRSPTAALSVATPLFGLFCGVVDGAVAGATFVLLGHRKSNRWRLDGAQEQVGARVRTHFRWSSLLVVLGLGVPAIVIVSITTREKPQPQSFPIAGTTYQWPAGTRVVPPQPPGYYGKGHVSYRSSNRYPDPHAFFIIYDGNAQEPFNEAGLPHLRMITSRFDRPADFSFEKTAAGEVVCNRRSAKLGIAYPCGLSFVHRGARWELHFGAHQANDAEQIYSEAISRLESFRRASHR